MSISRREALTLLLGAPLASEACQRPRPVKVSGSIRGASASVGHRLRNLSSHEVSSPPKKVRVAIVGAGPSGLSAAWRLSQLGEKNFAVFDLEAQAGGTSSSGADGVVPYPWGAHYVPVPSKGNRALVTLLDEMGMLESADPSGAPRAKEEFLVRAPDERLFIDGAWQQGLFPQQGSTPQDWGDFRKLEVAVERWVAFRDSAGRRAFTLPVAECSHAAEVVALDRMSATEWLDQLGIRSRRVRWFAEYGCRDDYGLTLKDTSAWALLFYFASRVPKVGSPSAPFMTWPEGNGRIIRHLADSCRPQLRLGRLITDLLIKDSSVELTAFDVRKNQMSKYIADYAILAVPKFTLPFLLRAWRDAVPEYIRQFSYSTWMVANLHLKRRPKSRGFPMAWDNVIYDSPSLGYVVASHQKFADYGPTVWTYYYPFTDSDPREARHRLLALDHSALVDSILSDLRRAHLDLEKCLQRVDIWRWGHAMVRPVPGLIWGEARRRAERPLGRVHFAHADLSGVSLFEEAQYTGIRAAEAVMMRLDRQFDSLLQG